MAQSSFGKTGAGQPGSFIGEGMTVEGEISGDDGLVVQGTVKGNIKLTDALTVEEGGTVEANIEASNATIHGHVTGDIVASDKVELSENGRLIGDVRAARIQIASGATFKGHIDMDV